MKFYYLKDIKMKNKFFKYDLKELFETNNIDEDNYFDKKVTEFDIFSEYLFSTYNSDTLFEDLKKNPETIFNHILDYKVYVLQKEIEDFSETNIFLNQNDKHLKDLKSDKTNEGYLSDLIAEQELKVLEIYNKYDKITDLYHKLIKNKNTFLELNIESNNKTILKKYSRFDKGLMNKFKSFVKSYLDKNNPDLKKYNNIINENKIITKKIINNIDNEKKFLTARNKNIESFHLEFNTEKEITKKQLISLIRKDKKFIDVCENFNNQKKVIYKISNYDKELSDFYVNAIGCKADLIMNGINEHLKNIRNETNKELCLTTKISKSLTNISPILRPQSIEGKNIKDILLVKGSIFAAKSLLTQGICFTLLMGACIQIGNSWKEHQVNSEQINQIVTNIKNYNVKKENKELEEITLNNVSDIIDKVNSYNETDIIQLFNKEEKK